MSKILIIEDEVAIADLEKDYLELSDFKVDICNTGDEGLRSGRRKIFPFSWYQRRRTTLIRSAA